MVSLRLAVILGAAAAAVALGLRPPYKEAPLEAYSFAQFARDHSRSYEVGTAEYKHREAVFQESLDRVHLVNARNAKEGRLWRAGVHPFMDWTAAERKPLNSGYKPAGARRKVSYGFLAAVQMQATTRSMLNQTGGLSAAQSLTVRNQGDCGSCWAISAVEAVEAQLAAQGMDVQLSAQALIDCVPNPQHCGGKGGCDGATAELGLQFMRDYGIPLEEDVPYTERTDSCPMSLAAGAPWPSARRARVSGWSQLPSNKVEPVLLALNQNGALAVAVDGGNWFDYNSGIFDGCNRDAVLSHGVLLMGYGEEAGNKYWRIQNSWGAGWGENGHIRMTRHDDEDAWCGTDNKPQDGIACDGGPPEITVCGMCGLLYDPVLPEGVRLEGGDAAAAPVADATAAAAAVPTTTAAPAADSILNDAAAWGIKQEPVPPSDDKKLDALLGKLGQQ